MTDCGVSFHLENQLFRLADTIPPGRRLYQPLHRLLAEVRACYGGGPLRAENEGRSRAVNENMLDDIAEERMLLALAAADHFGGCA